MNPISLPNYYQEAVRVRGSRQCPSHKQKEVVYACLDCETLLCTTCAIKSPHRPHNLEELTEIAAEKTVAMHDFINNIENNTLPQLKRDLLSTENQLEENSSKFIEMRLKMKSQGEKCKQEIDDLIGQWMSICENMERVNMELLQQRKRTKQNRHDVLTREVEECKTTLQGGSPVDVYDMEFNTLGNDTLSEAPVLQTAEFSPRLSVIHHLTRALGVFTCCNYDLLDRPTVVAKFPFTNLLGSICPTSEGHALAVLEYNNCSVLHLNKNGGIEKEITHDNEIRDVSRGPITDEVWFCSQQTVYEMKSTSPVAKFKVGREIWSMHVTNQREIIVGTREMLAIYTSAGTLMHEATRHETGIRGPMKLAQCPVTGNIAAVSWEENEGKEENLNRYTMYIIVYDRNLAVIFKYNGYGIQGDEIVTSDTFGPGTVAYDSYGNLIVGDWKRNTIELISGCGQYIKTLHRTAGQQGIIGIEPGNILWSQTDDEEIQILKYYKDSD
ncbi:uncharacterized protein LOC132552526 [Ylistrum balloti]|uniref:uncharacterized protein LOC132552526 n=1 Tax=Ylistrum balloti TaxID=509963 RepID=UPI00290582A2|nr:uncharacterized protein LOC132552526 [Ylistrum balloti]